MASLMLFFARALHADCERALAPSLGTSAIYALVLRS